MESESMIATVYVPLTAGNDVTADELTVPSTISMVKRYRDALMAEIDAVTDEVRSYRIEAVRFTGGIPLLLGGTNIADILVRMRKRFALAENAEVTVETIPGKLDEHNLRLFPRIGVNRLEFRIPTLVQEEHRRLMVPGVYGQIGADNAMRRHWGPASWGLQLAYGFEGHTIQSWDATLSKAIALAPSGVTLMRAAGALEPAAAPLLSYAARILAEHGYNRYGDLGKTEFDHFAVDGGQSRFIELRKAGVAQLGLGAGTASLYDGLFYRNTSDVERYVRGMGDPTQVVAEVYRVDEDSVLK